MADDLPNDPRFQQTLREHEAREAALEQATGLLQRLDLHGEAELLNESPLPFSALWHLLIPALHRITDRLEALEKPKE